MESKAACIRAEGHSQLPWHHSSKLINSVQDLPRSCKGILLDQYGCLHDGKKPYPEAIAAVRAMAHRGLRILILSNSSRRSQGALAKLQKLGFDPSWFEGAITSGEVTHQKLGGRAASSAAFWQQLGSHALHMTWSDRGAIVLDDSLGLEITQLPSDADFILAHGTEALGSTAGEAAAPKSVLQLEDILAQCAALNPSPPMIVANPDFVTTSGDDLVTMPGHLGRKYADMGGKVVLMGKPAPVIYEAAEELLNLQPHELVAIGDSLEHDVAGAARAGIQSLFIGGGIHRKELAISLTSSHETSPENLDELCSQFTCAANGCKRMLADGVHMILVSSSTRSKLATQAGNFATQAERFRYTWEPHVQCCKYKGVSIETVFEVIRQRATFRSLRQELQRSTC